MDRGDSRWPGGPVAPAPYPYERMGGKFPPHEVGQHCGRFERVRLVDAIDSLNFESYTASVRLEATCPDARLLLALSIYFAPDRPGLEPTRTFHPDTKIHLMSAVDTGGGLLPDEDLLGTRAVPVSLVSPGLWGIRYSPTEEVEAVIADLVLGGCGRSGDVVTGSWWAQAKWQAMRPMSEIEWRNAIALCRLTANPLGQRIPAIIES